MAIREQVKDETILLDDLYPAEPGVPVVATVSSPRLGLTLTFHGEIREVVREVDGPHRGRVVLVIYDPARGYDRLALPEQCRRHG